MIVNIKFIFKARVSLVYSGLLVYFPQGVTGVTYPPLLALIAPLCLLFWSLLRIRPYILVL